jgi:CubicO group peptidase (beta-lactamase class C family)
MRAADADSRDPRIDAAIGEHKLPGAVFHLERGGAATSKPTAASATKPDAPAVSSATVFDAASLSKVLATAPSVLMLAEEGKLDLDAKLVDYFPECANGGKEAITIRHLLTHSSGLPSGLPAKPAWHGDARPTRWPAIQVVTNAPGTLLPLFRHQLHPAGPAGAARVRHAARRIRAQPHLRAAAHAGHRLLPLRRMASPPRDRADPEGRPARRP